MVKIILMRHAESQFNVRHHKLREDLGCGKISQDEFNQKFLELKRLYDVDIINANLTEKGHDQCKNTQEEIYNRFPDIKRVILSPLRRVIQTFETTFELYPKFVSSKLKISFVEHLRECLYSNCDVVCWTDNERQSLKYPELYDWSFLDNYHDKDFWFLENGSQELYDEGVKLMQNCDKDDFKGKLLAL